MRTLRLKNKKVQQKILGKWVFLYCEKKDCLNPATIIMANNEVVLCEKHCQEYKKLGVELSHT